jgi:hypothetical protein
MSPTAPKARPFADLLLCLVGPAVWTVHFVGMYGAHALMCAGAGQGARAGLFLALAAAATAAALLGLVGFVTWCLASRGSGRRMQSAADETRFAREISIMLAVLSMLGAIWVALPALLVAPCASWSA